MKDHARTHLQLAVCDDGALDRAQIGRMAGELLREENIAHPCGQGVRHSPAGRDDGGHGRHGAGRGAARGA